MWRQAVHDRRVANSAFADRLCEDDARNATLQPSHLRQHDVGVTAGRKVIETLEGLRAQPVVVVAEEHILAASRIDADIAGLSGPARIRLVDDVNVGVRRCKLVQARWRVVGGTVIDTDDLELIGRKALGDQ